MKTREASRSTASNKLAGAKKSRAGSIALKCGLILLFALLIGIGNQMLNADAPQTAVEIDIVPTATPASEEQTTVTFTLDAEVVGQLPTGAESVYFVEYRGYPNYRILRLDEGADAFEQVIQIPKETLVYSLAISADKSQLLVAWENELIGFSNGIYTVDLAAESPEFEALIPPVDGVVYSSIAVADEGSFWATKVESLEGGLAYSLVEFDYAGNVLRSVADAINPVVAEGELYFLPLEADESRRSIGKLMPDGTTAVIDILDGEYDLDDFLFLDDQLYVAVLNRDQQASANIFLDMFSSTASAHGNHNTPATWVAFDGADFSYVGDSDWGAKIIYDSVVLQNGQILELTNEGLEVIDDERTTIIKSRALRLVTN